MFVLKISFNYDVKWFSLSHLTMVERLIRTLKYNTILCQIIKCFTWKWIFRKKRILCRVFALFLISTPFLTFTMYMLYFKCSFIEVEEAVAEICEKYQRGEALGNLCSELCESKTLRPNACLPHHLGKDVVFEAHYLGENVIAKSSKLNSDSFDQIFWKDDEGTIVYPNIESFYEMVHNSVQRNLNTSLSLNKEEGLYLINKLWTKSMQSFNQLPVSVQNTAMNNIWFLVQQTEYLLLKYHEESNIFPKITGTCGHLYIVEYVHPLDNLFLIFYPAWRETFAKRAKLALQILDYLENIERIFPMLHICDVKMGHFGLDSHEKMKMLDMDMVFFEPVLVQNMVAVKNCSQDQDCSFIDCKGSCNENLQKCEPKIGNNNFQRVCTSIFAGRFVQKYFGLLGFPPADIASQLHTVFEQCSNPTNDTSPQETLKLLHQLLESVINPNA